MRENARLGIVQILQAVTPIMHQLTGDLAYSDV